MVGFGSRASMELRLGPRRRSPRMLALVGDGADLISTLPDDLLLLVLARLGCAAAAARTGVLSRRWRGLWARLRRVVFNDVALHSLEAALGCIPPPPPAVSLLQIRFPMPRGRVPKKQLVDTNRVNSLLRAAARLDPEEFFLAFPWDLFQAHGLRLLLDLPCFHRATSIEVELDLCCTIRCVPAGGEFSALERLSLCSCTADLDALLSRCPLLRTLRLTDVRFHDDVMSVNSPLLQELIVVHGRFVDHVNIVAPMLTQLTMFFEIFHTHSISILAPMMEKFSWGCYLYGNQATFGVWILRKLSLNTAEGQGQLSSLHVNACVPTRVQFSAIFG
ncbi:uncharacterized protein [Lolium perenne]|uniref:uncharacterized protein n=1 Tax=Lolium perenne TaxID=4522 RepID=UPI0021F5E6A3|nr:putative FBD-associated F-box protein At5g56560 [Lolium perenne]